MTNEFKHKNGFPKSFKKIKTWFRYSTMSHLCHNQNTL